MHWATGLSQNTIRAGLKELKGEATQWLAPERIRRAGGGHKRVEQRQPELLETLDRLVEPTSRGEPQCPLRWTCKSVNQGSFIGERQSGDQVVRERVIAPSPYFPLNASVF